MEEWLQKLFQHKGIYNGTHIYYFYRFRGYLLLWSKLCDFLRRISRGKHEENVDTRVQNSVLRRTNYNYHVQLYNWLISQEHICPSKAKKYKTE